MNDQDLKVLHSKILELVRYFNSFCKVNNITYYLMGGTALGAVRHKGFIPWDDDFDVFMDYENYSKFLSIAVEKLDHENFYLQREDTDEWPLYFSKLRMNGTTYIEKDVVGRKMHHGIFVDILCLNNASSNMFVRYLQYISARILSAGALRIKGYETNSRIKRMIIGLAGVLLTPPIKQTLLRFVRSFNNRQSGMVGHFFGRAPFNCTSFNRKDLGEPLYIKFEDLMLPVPSNVETYLAVRFGPKFMEMPSAAEKLKYPSHAHLVDVSASFENYMDD